MKKLIATFMFFINIYFLVSCDGNYTNDGPMSSDTIISKAIYESVSFNFLNSSVFLKSNDTTPIWSAFKPEVWSKSFVLVNYSRNQKISIFKARTKDSIFNILSYYKLPFYLKLRDTNLTNEFLIQIDSKKFLPGDYQDWIYFNDDIKLGFLAKVTIK